MRRVEEEKMQERGALFESMSAAGRAWYDRIIHEACGKVEDVPDDPSKEG